MLLIGNKEQIIDIISKWLKEKLENTNYRRKFVITFSGDIPVQVENSVVTKRTNLKSLHEADINITKQCMACVKDETNGVKVICDDANVFFLLTVYLFQQGCKSKVLIQAFDTS